MDTKVFLGKYFSFFVLAVFSLPFILISDSSFVTAEELAAADEGVPLPAQPRLPENIEPFDNGTGLTSNVDPVNGAPPWNPRTCPSGAYAQGIIESLPYLAGNDVTLNDIAPVDTTYEIACSMPAIRDRLDGLGGAATVDACVNRLAQITDWPGCLHKKGDVAENCRYIADVRMYELGLPLFSDFNGCKRWRSCFAPGTKLAMADQSLKLVEDLSVGDKLWNPVTKKAMTVSRIIEGPEALPLVRISITNNSLNVTQGHAVVTRDGVKRAIEVKKGDYVRIDAGKV